MSSLTVVELRRIASKRGVSLSGITRKADIIKALRLAALPSVPKESSVPSVAPNTRPSELKRLTVAQLREMAARQGISLTGLRRKEDIIKALLVASSAPVPKSR